MQLFQKICFVAALAGECLIGTNTDIFTQDITPTYVLSQGV